jgi:hypothetical protein
MKGLKPFLSLAVGLLACAIMVGCAGGIPTNGPSALDIAQFTVSDGVIGISYKFLLVASGGVQPYTWSTTSGQLPPGLSLASNGVISGTPTALGKFTFTAKVVDSQSPTAAYNSLTASITINPVLSLTATSLPSGLVGGTYSATITASNGLQPYTYSVTDPSSFPDGLTLTTTPGQNGAPNFATIAGTPTTAGVYSFSVQVTDAANEVASTVFTITVVGRLQGPYVLYFNGFDNGQPFYDVAQLTASGDQNGKGAISGVLDQIGADPTTSGAVALKNGSYNIGQGSNFGTLTFTREDNNETLNFSMAVSTHGQTKVILNNTSLSNTAYGSGLLKGQTATTVTGLLTNYSFGLFGNDSSGARYAATGMLALGNSTGNSQPITGEEDINDNGNVNNGNGLSQPISIRGGSLVQADPVTGRGTFTLTTSAGTLNYVYYVVSSTELVAVDFDSSGPSTLADILQQQVAGSLGGFTNGSLTGQALIQLNGLASSNGSLVPSAAVGVVTFDGAGNIARTDGISGYYTDQSDGGVVNPVQYATATYNVDATCGLVQQACGRVTVTLPAGAPEQVWYLVAEDTAFVVATTPAVMSGSFQSQSMPSNGFNVGSILGSYLANTITPVLPSVTNELDVSITPCCGGIWNQRFDASGPFGIVNQVLFTGGYNCGATFPDCDTFDTSLGRFVVTGPAKGTSDVEIVYVIGSGAGTTGNKGGLVGLNVGKQSDGTPDPNPRITVYSK